MVTRGTLETMLSTRQARGFSGCFRVTEWGRLSFILYYLFFFTNVQMLNRIFQLGLITLDCMAYYNLEFQDYIQTNHGVVWEDLTLYSFITCCGGKNNMAGRLRDSLESCRGANTDGGRSLLWRNRTIRVAGQVFNNLNRFLLWINYRVAVKI